MSVFTKEQQAQIDSLTSDKTTAAAGSTGASGKSASTFDRLLNQESGGSQFNQDGSVKTSSKGAIGIAQVMPATGPEAAKLAGLPWDENRYRKDPEYNKALGRAYFDEQLRTFGDERTALAAYNAGPGATAKAIARAKREGGDFLAYLPEETRKYVPAIMGGKFSAKPLPSSPEGRAMGGSTAWGQQPRYQDPGFNAAFEREALLDAADESPVSTSIGRGWEGLKHNAGLFLDNVTDDSQGAAERIKAKRQWDEQNPAPRSSQGFVEDWQRLAEDDYAGMFATFAKNPGGALNQMVEQTPNSLPALAIQIPVGIASSALYATGVGAPLAMGLQAVASFVGNVLPEGGAVIEERLAKSGINPNDTAAVAKWIAENRGANLEAGIKKAGGISLVDGATGYLAGKLIAGPSIRFAQAEAQVLAKAGVNTTDKAAIAAARATPAYKQAMAAPAKDLLDATTRAQKIVREVGGFSLEAAGDGVGEYAGSYAANGEASVKDAILEGAMGAGTSAAMTGANMALGSAKGPDMDRAALEALAATPQPVIKPNSPLSNAAEIARAAQPAPTAQPDPVQVDPFAERLAAMQSFVEDKAFIQALRGSQGYGPESVTEALSAFAKARNPNLDPKIRERALADLETFVQGFSNRPNFVFGQNTPEQATPPGQQVATINPQGGAVAPATPRDDGRTLNGEVITRPEKMAGANPNQLAAPPVLGLPTEDALMAKRQADADYDQAYQDLVKAEQLGATEAELAEYQRALLEAERLREDLESQIADADTRAQDAQRRESEARRREVLAQVIADGISGVNPVADVEGRFAAELQRQGYRDTKPTDAEVQSILRAVDVANAREDGPLPSLPNEADFYEPPRPSRAQPQQRSEPKPKQQPNRRLSPQDIRAYVAAGAILNGDTLTLPDGTVLKLKGPQIAAAREAIRKATSAQVESAPAQPSESGVLPQEAAPQQVESPDAVSENDPAADLAGEKIDSEWTAFAPETGTLGIPRDDMPQIKAEHRGAMTNFMNARGVDHRAEEVPADSLRPTQAEFSPEKVKRAMGFDGGDRSILVSNDDYVLDGHHQWLAKREAGNDIKVIRLDAPIAELVPLALEFPSSTTEGDSKQSLDSAIQILMDRTGGIGSPDGLIGPENADARVAIVAALTGKTPAEVESAPGAKLKTAVPQVERLLYDAAKIPGDNIKDRRAAFLDWLDGVQPVQEEVSTQLQPVSSEPFATFEQGASALKVLGSPGAIRSRLADAGIKFLPRNDGAAIPLKEAQEIARSTIPVRIDRYKVQGVPERLSDVTLEVMESGEVALISPAEISRHSDAESALARYVESYSDSPVSVADDSATHQDPGQPAEPVTQPVIAESIQKSAINTPFKPAEAKKWLMGEIDRAIANVPAENAELAEELARERSKTFDTKEAIKRFGQNSKAISAASDSFNVRRDDAIAKTAKQIGFVTFDVPGDGKFKVMNTVDGLNAFRSKVEKSSGFKAPASKPPVMERETDTGSYTPRDAIAAGEYLNAYELARLQGKPLRFGVGNNDTKAYTDASDIEGLIPGFKTFVGRRADGSKMPWAVIEESTGLSFGDGGTSKATAIASAKAKTKGYEQKIVDMLKRGGISNAKPQEQLETDWIKWAEAKEGRKLEDSEDYAANNQEPVKNETPANTGDSADSDAGNQEPIKNAELASIFTGLSSRGLAKSRAKKAAEAHPRAAQIAYVQDNFHDILTELEDKGLVKINCD